MMGGLVDAVTLLTVMPLRRARSSARPGGAAAWFPLVGLLVAGVVVLVDGLAGAVFPPPLAAALTLAAWVVVTGGLHLDGWLDVCDALAPGLGRDRALAAMKDPRVGGLGAVGGIVLLIVKAAALLALAAPRWPALVAAAVLARWGTVVLLVAFPYVRGPEGLGFRLARDTGPVHLAVATALAGGVVVGVQGAAAWRPAVVALVVVLVTGVALRARLGGLTGDVYGAGIELVETATLVAASAAAGQP